MPRPSAIRVAVNGYGVIGKRDADAVLRQPDVDLAGVADVAADWRTRLADAGVRMREAGLAVAGSLDDLLRQVDVVVDCTPGKAAAANIDAYRARGVRFIVQGGEKHAVTGHSFVAERNYASALGRECTRVASCNTTSIGARDNRPSPLLGGGSDATGRTLRRYWLRSHAPRVSVCSGRPTGLPASTVSRS